MIGFYDLPKFVQWIFAIMLFIGGLVVLIPLLIKPYSLLLLPILVPFFNISSVPFLRLIGYYKYLNPYVLSTVQTDKTYDLHNMLSFDYFINFKWADKGIKAQKILLGHYCKALITIIERIESNQLSPEVKIIGRSYFFNDRTAKKLGFTISKASSFWVINSVLSFIDLTCLYSFSKGKWKVPNLWKVKQAEIIGSDLVKKKEVLEGLVEKLLR